jgi:hypothetical protein
VDEPTFWSIIELFDWDKTGDDDAVLLPALTALIEFAPSEISEFHEMLAAKLFGLDTREHARWCFRGETDPDDGDAHISSDMFLYNRCVVVANGRAFYERVLADPTKFPAELEFESLLYLGRHAYKLKTGVEWDGFTRLSYESFSNVDGWRPTPNTPG